MTPPAKIKAVALPLARQVQCAQSMAASLITLVERLVDVERSQKPLDAVVIDIGRALNELGVAKDVFGYSLQLRGRSNRDLAVVEVAESDRRQSIGCVERKTVVGLV